MDIIESLRVSVEAIKEWANKRFNTIDSRLDALEYEPIVLNSFKNNVYDVENVKLAGPEGTTIVEIGKTIAKIDFIWSLSKEPTSQTVNGESVATNLRTITREMTISATEPGKSFSYSMSATDERDTSVVANTYVKFLNGVYYGVLEDGITINSDAILDAVDRGLLSKKLQNTTSTTFTKTASDGQRFAFAAPVRCGAVSKFNIGGLDYEWERTEIEFTNASGYTEPYYVWMNDEIVVDTRKIIVP